MSLLDTTNRLLSAAQDQGLSLGEISRRSGGTVDREWLKKFSARDVKSRDATVSRVQALHDTLVGIVDAPRRKRA